MFDTHCHLNFKAFKKILPDVIQEAITEDVTNIVIPGTDVKTSKRGVEIAQGYDWIYAAVGIHPHHVYKLLKRESHDIEEEIKEIESLVTHKKVVAIGEIGMDRHEYQETVYAEYQVDTTFIELQKALFQKQFELATRYNKSLIIHNREAKEDLLPLVKTMWDTSLQHKAVFHCCEPDEELLNFAKDHHMFLGVDGDVTFIKEKQQFIPKIPLEMLVLETDSPFLLPEPLRSEKKYPNKPGNIHLIAETVAKLRKEEVSTIVKVTTENAKRLFGIS